MFSVSLLFRQVTRMSFQHSFSVASRSYGKSREDKDEAIQVPVRRGRARISKLVKQNSEKIPRKDRTSISANKKAIDLDQLSVSTSHWTVKHVENVIPVKQIMKDNTTPSGLKEFLQPIIDKQGPSVNICKSPDNEPNVKSMLIRLCDALYFNDPSNGLTAVYVFIICYVLADKISIETKISASFPGAKVSATPEVFIAKKIRGAPLSRTQLRLICSEAKPLLRGSREHGEGQVAGEIVAAMLFNYILGGESSVPLVSIYTCGYYLRFVACSTPESYVNGLVQGTLHKITDRPVFTTYPAYNPNKPPEQQGFNLLDATERLEAISTLVQLRHNLICSCPQE